METVSISHFKAHCLSILARVKKTGQPVLVTRFGEPVAEVVPSAGPKKGWLGSLQGTARITGDIVSPVSENEWDALRT